MQRPRMSTLNPKPFRKAQETLSSQPGRITFANTCFSPAGLQVSRQLITALEKALEDEKAKTEGEAEKSKAGWWLRTCPLN